MKINKAEALLEGIFSAFSANIFRGVVERWVRRNYNEGFNSVENSVKLSFNLVQDKEKLDVMYAHAFTEIVGITQDMKRQLQQTMREGYMANESPAQMKERIGVIMNPKQEEKYEGDKRKMNWKDRLDNIFITESNRAANTGKMDAIRQSGLNAVKYLGDSKDARVCPICGAASRKYSDAKNGIPINEKFSFSYGGKTYEFDAPPIHPRCRCRVKFKVI